MTTATDTVPTAGDPGPPDDTPGGDLPGGDQPGGNDWRPDDRRRGRRIGPKVLPYLLLVPNMAIAALFTIWPAINGFNVSFYDSNNGRTFKSVGAQNYSRILSDREFWQAARNTGVFVTAFVLLSIALSIMLAVTLNRQRLAKGFFRGVFVLPYLLSPVVVGILWSKVLDREAGMLNGVLGIFGVQPGWLINPNLAMVATIFTGVWIHIGFYTLILLAGLQSIDRSMYEAADIDGASQSQQFRFITLPMLRPTTAVVTILSVIHGFQAFDFIYTLTGGGPLGSTTLMVQYIYDRAFESPIRYGLASAGAVILFLVIFTLTILNYLRGRRQEAI